MNRLLVLVIGVIGLGVVAMVIILIAGGGKETPQIAGLNPTTIGETAASESAPAGGVTPAETAAETDTAALAEFDTWADPLRAAGFTITADTVTFDDNTLVVAGLDIAAPFDALGWHWTASSVRIDVGVDGGAAFTPNGAMTLALATDPDPTNWPLTADSVALTSEYDQAGALSSATVTFANMTVGDAETSQAVTAAELSLQSALGGGEAADGSNATLHLSDLVLPGETSGALGSTIQSLEADFVIAGGRSGFGAPWRGDGGSVTLNNIALQWGALRLTGSGTLAVDEMGRPAGTLNVDIANILLVLDAFNAVAHFDRDMMADTYANLLLEMGDDPEAETLPFTIAIEDGQIVLQGAPHGIADIALGTVSPLFTPATTQ